MLTAPDLSPDRIIALLSTSYGVRATDIAFLPLGADLNTAVYRVSVAEGTPYFLKLRRGNFDEIAVAVPAFLHDVAGITAIMAPLTTINGTLSVNAHGFDWMLYPFVEGANGFDQLLSDAQWITFGAALKAIHSTLLPSELLQRMPKESYSPRWRTIVTTLDAEVRQRRFDDPIASQLAAFWKTKGAEIQTLVERAEELSRILQGRTPSLVVCHGDIHAWNILLGTNGQLYLVDWDTLILAPKERDLMFVGSSLGGIWNTVREETLFYQGYGATDIDRVALGYYRYERIVEDIAVTGEQILGIRGSEEDRAEGLQQIISQFHPNSVIAAAHRTYQQID